ncbi:MAG: hypothetical protein ABI091_02550 [Ferruginibacter sp.]
MKIRNHLIQFKKILFSITFLLYFIPSKSFSKALTIVNQADTVMFDNFLFNKNKIDTVGIENKFDFLNFFNIIKCISGNVYFSGNGFSGIVAIKFTGNADELRIYFEHCISGSKFTLENCSFYRDGGASSIILSKTVLFL